MSSERDAAYLESLVSELVKLPRETNWVEFKENNSDPEMIGRSIAALSNAAALEGKTTAYLVWGIQDGTHIIVGSIFAPGGTKKGNEHLESWLVRLLSPRLHFSFHAVTIDGKALVLLEIPRANERPTAFEGREYVRISSTTQPLANHPQKEQALWRVFDHTPFENRLASTNVEASDVLALLDYPAYFQITRQPLPEDRMGIINKLEQDKLVVRNDAGLLDITNLGVVLFAKELGAFPSLARKAVRLIVYEGRNRVRTSREQIGVRGYASGFEGLISFLNNLLPRNEVIGQALRHEVPMYPELAVRELIANALIHQDFTVTGAGPMVEVFEDRLEITNPGTSLIDVNRLLDHAPRSRNEALASFMRRIGICEERGSGVDKVVFETEFNQLPPPRWLRQDEAFRVVLFAHREFRRMDRAERVHACYLHACLRYVTHDPMTNTSLRERFGIEPHNAATASRIIRDALDDGLIKPYEEGQAKKIARYLPAWA
jgi:predicted HTH transcriptional regulator